MAGFHDLHVPQGERFRRGFRWKVDDVARSLAGYSWRAQARQKEDPKSALILDLTPYLELDGDDDTLLRLDMPGTATTGVEIKRVRDTSAWDLFVWPVGQPDQAFCLLEGTFSFDPAATDMRSAS